MYVERNMFANLLKHLCGEKDTLACCKDMEEVGATPHLWLQRIPGSVNFLKPRAPYVFSEAERVHFLKSVASTGIPIGFSSTLIKHIREKTLTGLKSHDDHVIQEYILPRAI